MSFSFLCVPLEWGGWADARSSGQGAAKRMEGMTPASLVHLLKHARRVNALGAAPPGVYGTEGGEGGVPGL